MQDDWYPGGRKSDLLLHPASYFAKTVMELAEDIYFNDTPGCRTFSAEDKKMVRYLWYVETDQGRGQSLDAETQSTCKRLFDKALSHYDDLGTETKKRVARALIDRLKDMNFTTKYEVTYRMMTVVRTELNLDPQKLPCPLVTKIKNMKRDAIRLPNIIRMLVWTQAARQCLKLVTYFKLYDQSLALWIARGKPKLDFPEYRVLAYYVQHNYDLKEKKILGKHIYYGLEFLYEHYTTHGLSPLSAQNAAMCCLCETKDGLTMNGAIKWEKKIACSLMQNIYALMKYRSPTEPDELIGFDDPGFQKLLRTPRSALGVNKNTWWHECS